MHKSKEVDYAALHSPFARIPRMRVEVARCFLDIGLREIYELEGRSAEVLMAELRKVRPDVPEDTLYWFRMGVYWAENRENADPALMSPLAWKTPHPL